MLNSDKQINKKLRSLERRYTKINPKAVLRLEAIQRYADKLLARLQYKALHSVGAIS